MAATGQQRERLEKEMLVVAGYSPWASVSDRHKSLRNEHRLVDRYRLGTCRGKQNRVRR